MKRHTWTIDEPWAYELSTGRKLDAIAGVIGIGVDDHIASGHDDSLDLALDEWDGVDTDDAWTLAEKHELADFMIARWAEWKAAQHT